MTITQPVASIQQNIHISNIPWILTLRLVEHLPAAVILNTVYLTQPAMNIISFNAKILLSHNTLCSALYADPERITRNTQAYYYFECKMLNLFGLLPHIEFVHFTWNRSSAFFSFWNFLFAPSVNSVLTVGPLWTHIYFQQYVQYLFITVHSLMNDNPNITSIHNQTNLDKSTHLIHNIRIVYCRPTVRPSSATTECKLISSAKNGIIKMFI